MLAEVYRDRGVLQRLQSGVLGAALNELTSRWRERGYSGRVIQQYTRCLGHFAHWLERERLPVASLDGSTARRFLDEHLPSCRCPVPTGESILNVRPALGHLLLLLVGQGIPGGGLARPALRVPALDAFEAYLRQTVGVAPSTVQAYLGHARAFVGALYGEGPIDWARLTPADLTSYVTGLTARMQPGSAKQGAIALRSFLRSLQLSGLCSARLARAVPSVSYRRLSQLPKVLSDEQLRSLLESFDRDTAVGRRDYAMALCLVRLGLRSCEVARCWRRPGNAQI